MGESESRVWFITGPSKGFGRIWAEAALARGDRVAATARDLDSLDALVQSYGEAVPPPRLDVTDKPAVDCAVDCAPSASAASTSSSTTPASASSAPSRRSARSRRGRRSRRTSSAPSG